MRALASTLALLAIAAPALFARIDLLLIPPTGAVPAGEAFELTLHLNNFTDQREELKLARVLIADYASKAHRGTLAITVIDGEGDHTVFAVEPNSRAIVRLRAGLGVDAAAEGFASLRLERPETNPILIELAPAPQPLPSRRAPRRPAILERDDLDLSNDAETISRHIGAYDPIYFALGWRERFHARFQFSFKYRLLERAPPGAAWPRQLASDVFIGYTQTSIWDLETFSKPFYDSSYKPTAFFLHEFEPSLDRRWRFSLQAGAQHESNGKGGGPAPALPSSTGLLSPTTALKHPSDSRSLNTLYFAPGVRWGDKGDFFVEARARVSAYFQKRENADLPDFRGYVELALRAGHDRGWQMAVNARGKPSRHGSLEFNLTWPAYKTPLVGRLISDSFGAYVLLQYFNGYGESLLDYDVRRPDQFRLGVSLVR